MRSMTFSSASVSACEVDDVAATAAGVVGLRAGGGTAACCREAGASTGGTITAGGAVGFAAVLAAGVVLGTTPCAVGCVLGDEPFFLAAASAVAGFLEASFLEPSFLEASLPVASFLVASFLDASFLEVSFLGVSFFAGSLWVASCAIKPGNPRTSAKAVIKVIDRKAATRAAEVTAFPEGESFKRLSLRSI